MIKDSILDARFPGRITGDVPADNTGRIREMRLRCLEYAVHWTAPRDHLLLDADDVLDLAALFEAWVTRGGVR